jgi:hypothetical protein
VHPNRKTEFVKLWGDFMKRTARWSAAVGLSVAAFALVWWSCSGPFHRDEGISLGIAGAALAIVIAVAGWWAGLEKPGKESGGESLGDSTDVTQNVKAGGDAYVAGRDQTVNINRHKDE